MRLSNNGRAFIIDYEKRCPKAYKDSAEHWTIGIGHLITENELKTGNLFVGGVCHNWRTVELTQAQMDALFAQDIAPREKALLTLLRREPTQQEFDAMFSLMFNIGHGNFATSSVLRLFNIGAKTDTGAAFEKWNKVRNPKTKQLEVSAGLVKRRAQERDIFLHGIYDSTH